MKNKVIILAGLLSLSALNAYPPVTRLENQQQVEQYFQGVLDGARQSRAEGDYLNAGRTFYSLSRNQNENPGAGKMEVRPGTRIAGEAKAELNYMKARGKWNDTMHSRIMFP